MSDDIESLRRELADLRDEVQRLRGRQSSRREVLRRFGSTAGLAAIGGAALAVTSSAERAAAAPLTMQTGTSNGNDESTEIRCNRTSGDIRSHVFSSNDGSWFTNGPAASNEENTGTRAAVGGYAGTWAMHGGYFQTNAGTAGASGVRGEGQHPNSYGVRARGRRAALLIDRYADDSATAPPARLDAHSSGEVFHDNAGDLWFCVGSGSPGVWRKLAGPATSGQIHLLGTPVRCYDSRDGQAPLGVTKGPITAPRLVDCRVTLDGSPSPVPSDAIGLVVNVTVTEPSAIGFCAVYPGGSTYAGTSLLNFAAGQTIANGTSIACGPGATLTVRLGGGATGHVIIDVTGYYR